MLMYAPVYAGIGLLLLLVVSLADADARKAIIEVAIWASLFALLWPAFVLLVISYHIEDHFRG